MLIGGLDDPPGQRGAKKEHLYLSLLKHIPHHSRAGKLRMKLLRAAVTGAHMEELRAALEDTPMCARLGHLATSACSESQRPALLAPRPTPLDEALELGHVEFASMLTSPRWGGGIVAQLQRDPPKLRHKCLLEALRKGDVLLAKVLLSVGADPNLAGKLPRTLKDGLELPKGVLTPMVIAVVTEQRNLVEEMARTWGPMHWGHAQSVDAIQWVNKPIALYPDAIGDIFSGSAVVDIDDTSGFGKSGTIPLVAVFTYNGDAGQSQGVAYSNDEGNTWTKYEGNPALPNPGDYPDFRDPNVMWHEESNQWIMVLAVHDRVRFYASGNLKEWTYVGEFGESDGAHDGVWECPDLFSLNLDMGGGVSKKKWVLIASVGGGAPAGGTGTQYFIGDFDGSTFTNDNSPSVVLWLDYGCDNYAGVTWSNSKSGEQIFLGWMSNWGYASTPPTSPWRSGMTLPRTVTLKSLSDGSIVLAQQFSQDIGTYKSPLMTLSNQVISEGSNLISDVHSIQFEIIAQFQDDNSTANEYGFKVRVGSGLYTTIGYSRGSTTVFVDRRLSGDTSFYSGFANVASELLLPEDGQVEMHIYVDWASVELIANGFLSISELIFPSVEQDGIELYCLGGSVSLNSLEIYAINSSARPDVPLPNFINHAGDFIPQSGTWEENTEGLCGQSGLIGGDIFSIGTNYYSQGTYLGILRIGLGGAAALVFNAASDASAGWVVNIDSGGLIKVWKIGSGSIAEYHTTIMTHYAYPMKVVFTTSTVNVFFNNGTSPVISLSQPTYSSTGGYLGLNVFNGESVFQNIDFSESTDLPVAGWNTNLRSPFSLTGGYWNITTSGLQGTAESSADAFYSSSSQTTTTFTYECDMTITTQGGASGLLFRSTDPVKSGYVINIDDSADLVKLWTVGYGAIKSHSTTINTNQQYHLKVTAASYTIRVYLDYSVLPVIELTDSSLPQSGFAGLNVFSGTASFQNVYFHGCNN
ncbi:glycoside hydrolase family 32 protein [Pelomyxa schiedti]|nr:glycoside hydrolase family 32 protein [Pelomyxa schiedti]